MSSAHPPDVEEVENLLLYNLPALCCRLSDWPSLLREAPGLQLCDYKGLRATQYCLVIMLQLALQQGDRYCTECTRSAPPLEHTLKTNGNISISCKHVLDTLTLGNNNSSIHVFAHSTH